jgi:hypothetical protein
MVIDAHGHALIIRTPEVYLQKFPFYYTLSDLRDSGLLLGDPAGTQATGVILHFFNSQLLVHVLGSLSFCSSSPARSPLLISAEPQEASVNG